MEDDGLTGDDIILLFSWFLLLPLSQAIEEICSIVRPLKVRIQCFLLVLFVNIYQRLNYLSLPISHSILFKIIAVTY